MCGDQHEIKKNLHVHMKTRPHTFLITGFLPLQEKESIKAKKKEDKKLWSEKWGKKKVYR